MRKLNLGTTEVISKGPWFDTHSSHRKELFLRTQIIKFQFYSYLINLVLYFGRLEKKYMKISIYHLKDHFYKVNVEISNNLKIYRIVAYFFIW